jgi:hypothetical protein
VASDKIWMSTTDTIPHYPNGKVSRSELTWCHSTESFDRAYYGLEDAAVKDGYGAVVSTTRGWTVFYVAPLSETGSAALPAVALGLIRRNARVAGDHHERRPGQGSSASPYAQRTRRPSAVPDAIRTCRSCRIGTGGKVQVSAP